MGIKGRRQECQMKYREIYVFLFSSFLLLTPVSSCGVHGSRTVSHRVTVHGEEMLVGTIEQEELFREFPDFQMVYDDYVADAAQVDSLKTLRRPIQVEVYLGTWCGDSRHHVPVFLKLLDAVRNPSFHCTMIGLDRTKRDVHGNASARNIVRVPTMIFLENGIEIGRITESPFGTMEEDVVRIVRP